MRIRDALLGGFLVVGQRRAQADGEVRQDAGPEAQARLLLFTVQGLSLVSRTGLDTAGTLAAVDALIDALRA